MLPAAAPSTLTVRVLLFARYADLLGRDALDLILEGPATVSDALDRLRELPGAKTLPLRPLCAVNQAQVTTNHLLSDGDEVAILPPMSGG